VTIDSLADGTAHDGAASTSSGPCLAAIGLDAGYGDAAVVRNLDLHVHAGEIVALLGPNGAGKSTTLLTLAGELPPLAGEVAWYGEPTTEPLHKRAARGLAFVPEDRSVLMSMSVRDNLLLGRGGVEGAVEVFPELGGLLDRRAGLLSGGEQQMLTLGRAIATEPKVLHVDELSLGLAPLVVERLLATLRRVADERHVAVVLVEQQVRRALSVSDRWYLMRNGAVVAQGDHQSSAESVEAAFLTDVAPGGADDRTDRS
jgi:branched-chain amino acid transport system ATP-binding protein